MSTLWNSGKRERERDQLFTHKESFLFERFMCLFNLLKNMSNLERAFRLKGKTDREMKIIWGHMINEDR